MAPAYLHLHTRCKPKNPEFDGQFDVVLHGLMNHLFRRPLLDRRQFMVGAAAAAALAACGGSREPVAEAPAADPTSAPDPTVAPDPTAAADPTAAPDPTPVPDPAEAANNALASPGSPGLVDEQYYNDRVNSYLDFATAVEEPGSPSAVGAHLSRAHRDPDYSWAIDEVTVEALAPSFTKIAEWRDTRDFDFMYLNFMVALGQGDTASTQLSSEVLDAIKSATLGNRFRYDDPLPDDRVDHLWYWSENHRLITLSNELIAGEFYPDDTFEVTGLTGREHAERAKPEILEWITERGRFGFFEWHSNVYMAKNVSPLLMLCEISNDPDVVQAAAVALDSCLLDMATHYHQGAYVAPHGRTYKKDKMTARDEDTFDMAKLLFDRTPGDYESTGSTTATYFCAATRYRPPQLVIDIAQDDSITVVRERHGVYADAYEPITDNPEAPFGFDFNDPKNLPFWWSLGAVGMWQVSDVGVAQADKFRLWEGDAFADVKLLYDVQGGDAEALKAWLQANPMILNLGFLSEANTYAWRSPQISLASVLDHRKGEMRDQVHAWQATIDPDARVFTTHPMTEPAESDNWRDDDIPGYWTGEASMPRSAQFERTGIHLYQPAWDRNTDPLLGQVFPYREYTHAYFPQDHFDQVVEQDGWVFGAKDGGFVALWSWRPAAFRELDGVTATNGMSSPFDLVAEGGADNVWIVEVATEVDGSFDEFIAAVTANEPDVERTEDRFTVAWQSPAAGALTFGWDEDFTVAGSTVPVAEFPRHDSPWGQVERLETVHEFSNGDESLTLDFESFERTF